MAATLQRTDETAQTSSGHVGVAHYLEHGALAQNCAAGSLGALVCMSSLSVASGVAVFYDYDSATSTAV